MASSLKTILISSFAIGTVMLNGFYFIPRTIEWLSWKSGVTMAYVGIELIGNYFIHIFFLFACLSLTGTISKSYKLGFLAIFIASLLVSFFFAFRVIEWAILVFVLIYAGLFYKIFTRLKVNDNTMPIMNVIGFSISYIWLVIDYKYLN